MEYAEKPEIGTGAALLHTAAAAKQTLHGWHAPLLASCMLGRDIPACPSTASAHFDGFAANTPPELPHPV